MAAFYFFIDSISPKKKEIKKTKWFWRVSIMKNMKKNREISRFGIQSLAKNINGQLKNLGGVVKRFYWK
jgi:NADH pyrophosphatase NudC (nudix superfamily)